MQRFKCKNIMHITKMLEVNSTKAQVHVSVFHKLCRQLHKENSFKRRALNFRGDLIKESKCFS